ncbi:hypothetical protein FRC01_001185 [Tulasnella sp. 417]|nr:hypothetical protein FRC01_001185 [Tulasnella sp. 417]
MSKRFRPPELVQTPKSKADGSINYTVNSSLKALRRASKQAGAGVNAMNEDMRILERVFYKSNNSQSPTMAWKKLKHMRRLYWRLHECELVNFLDSFRLTFYPLGTTVKQMKTAWTHVPSFPYVEACLKRLILICSLVTKCSEACNAVYSAFALNLVRTGFLPLGVSIMAIAARLQRVGKELLESISLAASGLLPLLDKLKSGTSFKYQRALDEILYSNAGLPSAQRGFSSLPGEIQDLGEAIARQPAQEPEQALQRVEEPISIVLLDDDWEDEDEPTLIQAAKSKLAPPPADEALSDDTTTIIEVTKKNIVDKTESKAVTKDKVKKSKRTKRLKPPTKRDEIDDIFEF